MVEWSFRVLTWAMLPIPVVWAVRPPGWLRTTRRRNVAGAQA